VSEARLKHESGERLSRSNRVCPEFTPMAIGAEDPDGTIMRFG
jgi:hypothetical protein